MPMRSQEVSQPEFMLTEPATPDMRFADRLLSQVQRELAARGRKMLRVTSKWLDLYEYVKMLEENHLFTADPIESHRHFFLGTLSLVKGMGDNLVAHLQNDDAEQLNALGLTYADLVACVSELSDLDRALRSDISPEMIAEMNARLFGGGHA